MKISQRRATSVRLSIPTQVDAFSVPNDCVVATIPPVPLLARLGFLAPQMTHGYDEGRRTRLYPIGPRSLGQTRPALRSGSWIHQHMIGFKFDLSTASPAYVPMRTRRKWETYPSAFLRMLTRSKVVMPCTNLRWRIALPSSWRHSPHILQQYV